MALWILTGFGAAIFITGRLILGKYLPAEVPLWYSRPWGEEQLTSPNSLVVVPVLMIGIAILTQVLMEKIKKSQEWVMIVGWSGIIAITILVLSLLRIWILAL